MFCPLAPMASAKLSSFTASSIDLLSSSITMDSTFAGESALITICAGLSSKIIMSILSLPNSPETD